MQAVLDDTLIDEMLILARQQGRTVEASYSGLVGLVIAVLRTEKQWSQSYLAKISRVSQPTISRIETGESDITIPQMDALARSLDTTSGFILDVSDELRRQLQNGDVDVPVKGPRNDEVSMKGAVVVAATGALLGGGPLGLLIGAAVGAIISSVKRDH